MSLILITQKLLILLKPRAFFRNLYPTGIASGPILADAVLGRLDRNPGQCNFVIVNKRKLIIPGKIIFLNPVTGGINDLGNPIHQPVMSQPRYSIIALGFRVFLFMTTILRMGGSEI